MPYLMSLYVLLFLKSIKLEPINYVKSNSSSYCPSKMEVCLTFREYVENSDKFFTRDQVFLFLPGVHSASKLQISNVSNITLKGVLNTSTVATIDAVIHFQNVTNITIEYLFLSVTNQVRKLVSILTFTECKNVILKNLVTEDGFAYLMNQVSAVEIKKSIAEIINCNFSNNFALIGGALSILDHTIISLTGVHFFHNSAQNFGGAVFASISNITFHQSNTFINNAANSSGGGIYSFKCNVTFSGETKMSENWGSKGGAIYAEISHVTFTGYIKFEENFAEIEGGAICAFFNSFLAFSGLTIFNSNSAYSEGGGAILAAVHSDISLNGFVLFSNNNCTTCYGGAISITLSSTITIRDNVTLQNNWAEMGGAIYFRYSDMVLKQGSIVITIENKAKCYGGAFFHEDSINYYQCDFYLPTGSNNTKGVLLLPDCFIRLENISLNYNSSSLPYQIISSNDAAGEDGHFLYGGLLDKCRIYDATEGFVRLGILYDVLIDYHIITIIHTNMTDINVISSEAFTLCFCEDNENFDCIARKNVSVVRGAPFAVSVLALSQGHTITAPVLIPEVDKTARLQLYQISRNLTANCTTLTYNMFSTLPSEVLVLYPNKTCRDIGMAVSFVQVHFEPCPDGFSLSNDECGCDKRLSKYNASCNINAEGEYVIQKRSFNFWVKALYFGLSYQGLILYKFCPDDHCKNNDVSIFLNKPDMQCNFNRSGKICGACADNYSLIFGNSKCQLCSNQNLLTIPLYAAAGILLIFFLTIFKLTVATGMVNSIILYANIVQANRNLFLPDASNNILTIFIAWMNLDIGFPTCFYHGMNAYTHTWLQFVFPIYIWVLIAFIIITSRYSKIMTRLIGSNPVAVLATLLLMSYAKLLKTIIQIFSFVYLDYPQNYKVQVWLKDANEPYLKKKHLYLAVFGSLFIATFFLPYTFLLLLGFKLYRYSNKPCIHWLLLKLKPLLDSYYAPYQKHTRYWTGFLLLLHCVLYIVFSFNPVGGSDNSLLAITTGYTTVIVIAWLSVKIYKNFYVNVIEASVFLDLIILSAAKSNNIKSPVLAYTLIGFVFALALGILVFQFHQVYLTKCSVWHLIVSKIKSLYTLCTMWLHLSKTERDPPNNAAVKEEDSDSSNEFRESLMENYVSF